MFERVLIANRGAIAVRIARSLRALGITPVMVYSDADADSLHVAQAELAISLGESRAAESYLQIDKILAAAKAAGAQAIHPGYGFLSENLEFAAACEAAGIVFIGPTPVQIKAFGLKHSARALALQADVPVVPGSELLADVDAALAAAAQIGYPVMLKSTAGGGGIGMQLCQTPAELENAFAAVQRLSRSSFSNGDLFLERYIAKARHVEVQIFGDGAGKVVALGERDCSLQRRNQKVVEEAPAPNLSPVLRTQMLETAVRLGELVHYRSAGTVEYIYDVEREQFYFLEVNTRLQVEHGVTEAVTGVDLVAWMVRLAAGDASFLQDYVYRPQGHAVQVRLYAEDPALAFQPSSGLLTDVQWPDAIRCDTWIATGVEVSAYYDPMLAKLIAHGADRTQARHQLATALAQTRVAGLQTNLDYLRQILADACFAEAAHTTRYLNEFPYQANGIQVLDPGMQTTVQDWPGRQGYWHVGVPPSGPFDDLALRLGNALLGNAPEAAGLEMTLTGASLLFRSAATVVITGADMAPQLDAQPVPNWTRLTVAAGSRLCFGAVQGAGARTYLCVAGGIDVPPYLGSGSTFTLGKFGGHGGRALRAGDVLPLTEVASAAVAATSLPALLPPALQSSLQPALGQAWQLRVIYGPHGAPDFFTPDYMDQLLATDWEVHYNSSRTGIRLVGPKPGWARADGGEAGLHPSNIHDNAYTPGAVDFTGDMPVILGPDGPSLGGFVCPVTVIKADLWQLGQLRAGDKVRFVVTELAAADAIAAAQAERVQRLQPLAQPAPAPLPRPASALLHERRDLPVAVTYRPAGEDNVLVEYGEQVLDLALRFRVQALLHWLQGRAEPGLLELTPGVRSLQVHYDNARLPRRRLLDLLQRAELDLGDCSAMSVPSRIIHLPLSWNDPACQLAVQKYMQSVNPDAPWCPDNLEFIRRINGLASVAEVKSLVFAASYLVMGLGDVYLGAPVATPLDPRHRLVTTKYNPARTWTPENAVGIGGAYLCVYGMEGPGGYQFVGRTIQMWNRWRQTPQFPQPWLLRFFDQLRFYEVSADELLQMREDFPRGRLELRIEESSFNLADYQQFLARNQDSINSWRAQQQQAFTAERARWEAAGQDLINLVEPVATPLDPVALAADEAAVQAPVAGNVWEVSVQVGQRVAAQHSLALIESMKMEVPLLAPRAGVVRRVLVQPGQQVQMGQTLLVLGP